ncbi:CBS domain-containing protein [Gimesia sp.]|uniref:CBS domain-containing protein n=1 Tax=Gimesia sp. TaxID=2024833 RepID=UPI000C4A823C|nr:CBS domain-containing protein [Gimesia sp.]MAX36989.1 inosine-5-monophosphate dehydrogenase [Gimesia sp.]HAH47482.1 inosine-5-monophosphate dehydrogenase [Planctomycetaceae bacterium]HBL48157.1 inosine-5-monophosphate dehydrogenase [Planctomycetaceae bacterium]|tara:strand:+ start:1489 stop:1968 length:480 start_codon:yes stop_codon:yes gene_type:complete
MDKPILAKDIMVTKLITLTPDMDVLEAIGMLLNHRISGAPVIDAEHRILGVFSEKCCMDVLIKASYEQLPSSQIFPFMDTEARCISEDMDLLTIAQIFLSTPTRRLPVVSEDRTLLGQISRRDLLQAGNKSLQFRTNLPQEKNLLYLSGIMNREESPIS